MKRRRCGIAGAVQGRPTEENPTEPPICAWEPLPQRQASPAGWNHSSPPPSSRVQQALIPSPHLTLQQRIIPLGDTSELLFCPSSCCYLSSAYLRCRSTAHTTSHSIGTALFQPRILQPAICLRYVATSHPKRVACFSRHKSEPKLGLATQERSPTRHFPGISSPQLASPQTVVESEPPPRAP